MTEQWAVEGLRGSPSLRGWSPCRGAVRGALPTCPRLTVVRGCSDRRGATEHRGFAGALCQTSPSRRAHGGLSHLPSLPHEAGGRATVPGRPVLRSRAVIQEPAGAPDPTRGLTSHSLGSPDDPTQLPGGAGRDRTGQPDLHGAAPRPRPAGPAQGGQVRRRRPLGGGR